MGNNGLHVDNAHGGGIFCEIDPATGVIMTDDLVMQAITDQYGAGEAAVMAVLAGNDLLCSTEYATQYQAVLQAVLDGRISVDTLNAAVRHVLVWKQQVASYG